MTRVAAVIPVGSLEGGKSRLGEQLDAEERQDLVAGFLSRTVVAALAVDGLADVLVVSPDRDVLTHAASLGARTLAQKRKGPNAGLRGPQADFSRAASEAPPARPNDLPSGTSIEIVPALP